MGCGWMVDGWGMVSGSGSLVWLIYLFIGIKEKKRGAYVQDPHRTISNVGYLSPLPYNSILIIVSPYPAPR